MNRGELRARREALEALWRRGIAGKALLAEHTALIDAAIVRNFQQCPVDGSDICLVALGGYGRGELFPFSDVDLLLLHGPTATDRIGPISEAILYPLWDAGLEVGHGVRTPEECLEHAAEDFFFQVALLDARHLAGNENLFNDTIAAFQEKYIEGSRREFIQNMMDLRSKRHNRFGLHGYLLEPHIKESQGGFRDIQSMLWTAQAVFGLHGLDALREAGLLDADETKRFETAADHLIRIRNRLHYISGRKNDQLFFEHQEDMAKAFDYREENGMLAVEGFMRDVYANMQTIAVTTDLFFEHVDESLGLTPPTVKDKPLDSGIEIFHGHIHLANQHLLAKNPTLILRLFNQMAKTGLPLHHRTRKQVQASLQLVDDRLRGSRLAAKSFLDMLTTEHDPLPALSAMLESGLLTAYIPEFSRVESLAQHDIYHLYTVDRHLLQTVSETHRLYTDPEQPGQNLNAPRILMLAALLHDIGKGEGHGHADRGAELAMEIADRLGLPESEQRSLSFLIRNHLFLTKTALRRDLEDETLIQRCARKIQTPEQLTMLYLLSVADSRATGPEAWNEWKAALLQELYLKIALLLESSGPTGHNRGQGLEWMRNQLTNQLGDNQDFPLEILPEEYLFSFTPEIVQEHIAMRNKLAAESALLEPKKHEGYWTLHIMAHDRTGLLSRICGVLALRNLTVLAAQIFTWADGTAVDVLDVKPAATAVIQPHDWEDLQRDLNLALANRLGLAHRLETKYRTGGPSPPQTKRKGQNRVILDNNVSETYTTIEVYADDHPGLLYHITRTLADFAVSIHQARISVEIDQAVDVFYVTDPDGGKIKDRQLREEIRQGLLHASG